MDIIVMPRHSTFTLLADLKRIHLVKSGILMKTLKMKEKLRKNHEDVLTKLPVSLLLIAIE